jgi:8-oxo-dGTP pyrophosphatase MutT (NUDIX family)
MSRNCELKQMKRRAITSYGIILFTVNNNNEILYQLCQRRDSISYAEFLKDTLDESIIPYHINLMSREERKRCVDYYKLNQPEKLWDDLWVNHKIKIYKNDMETCCRKFNKKMEKYIDCFTDDGGKEENSWGFAKGRKMASESELNCALREFTEETTIPRDSIQVLDIKPFDELYTGTDGRLYRSVYYIAYIPYIPSVLLKQNNTGVREEGFVSEEVSQILWCDYNSSMNRIDRQKQTILRSINKILLFPRRRKAPMRRFTN